MEDRNNCGACYFHDRLDHEDGTIYCIVHEERRKQYTGCEYWRRHNNDPSHIKEERAKSIRDKLRAQKQNKVDEERHEESNKLTKKGIILTVIGIIIAILLVIFL